MKKETISVLIPDGESHILIHVINCLAQIKSVKTYLMSNQKNSAMNYSRHVHHFSYYPKTSNETEWITNINKEIKKHSIDVLMPIFEEGIGTITKLKHLIPSINNLGIFSEFENFNIAINKEELSKFMNKHFIPSPEFELVKSNGTYKGNLTNFPIIIKPIEGFGGGQGIQIFDSEKDIESYFNLNKFEYTYLVQEYIKGYDIDCSVLCKEGNILAYTIQKGTMIGKNKFSPQYGLQFLENKLLFEVVDKLMKALNWSGVAHIDLRYDEISRQFKVIEVNTRFWVSLDASLIAGVNFPYLYCLTSLDRSFEQPEYEYIDYLNLKGLIKKIKNKKRFIFNLKFILNNTPMKFAIKDPIPMVYKYVTRTKNILISKFKKTLLMFF